MYIILSVGLDIDFSFLITLFLGMFFALVDEYHQMFSLNRTPKITDVGIDTLGVITGTLTAWIIVIFFKMIFKRREEKS